LFPLSGTGQFLLALPKNAIVPFQGTPIHPFWLDAKEAKDQDPFRSRGQQLSEPTTDPPSDPSFQSGLVPMRGSGGSPRLFFQNSAEVVGFTNTRTRLTAPWPQTTRELARLLTEQVCK
jgi:hypothetical protein